MKRLNHVVNTIIRRMGFVVKTLKTIIIIIIILIIWSLAYQLNVLSKHECYDCPENTELCADVKGKVYFTVINNIYEPDMKPINILVELIGEAKYLNDGTLVKHNKRFESPEKFNLIRSSQYVSPTYYRIIGVTKGYGIPFLLIDSLVTPDTGYIMLGDYYRECF